MTLRTLKLRLQYIGELKVKKEKGGGERIYTANNNHVVNLRQWD